jgi:hypothetical protein
MGPSPSHGMWQIKPSQHAPVISQRALTTQPLAAQVYDASAEEGAPPNFQLVEGPPAQYWEVPLEGQGACENPVPAADGSLYQVRSLGEAPGWAARARGVGQQGRRLLLCWAHGRSAGLCCRQGLDCTRFLAFLPFF